MAKLGNPIEGFDDIPPPSRSFAEHHSDLLEKLMQEAAKVPEGQVEKALIRFQVADGYAFYRVEKADPLILNHVPFGDAYRADPILIKGLDLDDVKNLVTRERALRELLNKPRKPKV